MPPRNYDVMPDGRFLMRLVEADATANREDRDIQVVLNWSQELLERVPVP